MRAKFDPKHVVGRIHPWSKVSTPWLIGIACSGREESAIGLVVSILFFPFLYIYVYVYTPLWTQYIYVYVCLRLCVYVCVRRVIFSLPITNLLYC